MIENEIHFELISPEKKLVSEAVYLAEIPGDDGMFGVLPGHSSMLVSLGVGVVRLHKTKDERDVQRIFIAGGFADVTGKSCTVLAEEAIVVNDLDQVALEQRLSDLSEDLEL
ncbi:MAG: ATP synthase F1 subunit epsilon, partial [Alphaproteobacteria bacterium]|nr:ATP synthase F1 subunit epsilon [Alphaproteobacteria bacterium]